MENQANPGGFTRSSRAAITPEAPARHSDRRLICQIGDYIFLPSNTAKVDVAICLGCTCYQRATMQAVRLFQSGQCSTLLFTGGPNRKIGGNEAIMMANLACSMGVRPNAILIDEASTNTLENSIHSRQILEQQSPEGPAPEQAQSSDHVTTNTTITLISIHYHSRRAYETFSRTLGKKYALTTTSYPSRHYTAADWFASDRGQMDVSEELRKIHSYLSIDIEMAVRLH